MLNLNKMRQAFIILSFLYCSYFAVSSNNSNPVVWEKDSIFTNVSNTKSDTILIHLTSDSSENIKEDKLKKFLDYIIQIATIAALLLGVILGYPAILRKLQEEHIKELIKTTQETNNKIKRKSIEIINKYSTRAYKDVVITKNEIQEIYNEIVKLNEESVDASKEVNTLTFLLKTTFQGILRYYNPGNNKDIYSSELFNLYLSILGEVVFFTTKVVNLPRRVSTSKIKRINKKLDKFLNQNTFKKYKYFEQGLDYSSCNAVVFSFYANVFAIENHIFYRAAYNIIKNPAPIIRMLYLEKLYIPPILKKEKDVLFFKDFYLHLIGYKIYDYKSEKEEKKIVKCYYANISDSYAWIHNINLDDLKNNFKDNYLNNNKKEIVLKINSLKEYKPECIAIELDFNFLNRLFIENRKFIKQKMIQEKKKKKN